ncbi:hypothetical protein RJ639_037470 [Escallonia herrerae]|uniref:Pentatricopeptide repeat-containing protein n=1 Tax=Escallonia herrerae TaxID=1293975 RepID=A0AA88WJJ8_9ASTE|nr:hypothetical protein RJ639_037470 [Escallonia herrerae]
MHTKLVKQALLSSLYLRSNLLNMYAKCSHLPDALKLFDEMTHKNVVSWTAVIAGFVQKGHPVEAHYLSLFKRMHVSGTKPNEFSFVGGLHACSFSKNHAHAYQTYALILRFGFQSNINLMKPKKTELEINKNAVDKVLRDENENIKNV